MLTHFAKNAKWQDDGEGDMDVGSQAVRLRACDLFGSGVLNWHMPPYHRARHRPVRRRQIDSITDSERSEGITTCPARSTPRRTASE
jgi:hypothetical protein